MIGHGRKSQAMPDHPRQRRKAVSRAGTTESPKKVKKRVILAVAGIALLGMLGYILLGPLSPDAVCARTVRALETGDVEALIRLADREEIGKLNLTPGAVEGVLRETMWRNGYPRFRKTERNRPTPEDVAQYEIFYVGIPENMTDSQSWVIVLDTPDRGWKLVLSQVLWDACWRKRGGKEGAQEYIRLARKYGITGLRSQRGKDNTIDGVQSHFPPPVETPTP
jgi:hypothetical protein